MFLFYIIKQTALGRDMLDNEKKLMLLVHAIIFEMAAAVPANRQSREDRPYIKTADNVVLDIKKIYRKAVQGIFYIKKSTFYL